MKVEGRNPNPQIPAVSIHAPTEVDEAPHSSTTPNEINHDVRNEEPDAVSSFGREIILTKAEEFHKLHANEIKLLIVHGPSASTQSLYLRLYTQSS